MKSVRIAELKARLSEHLRQVRRGHPLIVLDRETPVAKLVPYAAEAESLVVRQPRRKFPTIQDVPLPPPTKLDFDVVSVLMEERQGQR